ncbi:MAG: anthranilate phosphoribosyltransferase [Epsilonproteobacteria bacterium]|nr:anthranilate phosphoribosyltransferase [Campylobacterota bacterium]
MEKILEKLAEGSNLNEEEMERAIGNLADGNLNLAAAGALLFGLRAKGETVEEIAATVRAMRKRMLKLSTSADGAIDTCGTGGDGSGSFNISTAAAIVSAAAGAKIAKHGNRSASSKTGSADLLEIAGVNIAMSGETAAKALNEIGLTFLFAPLYHPAMKNVVPVRKALKIRTIFNQIGPLLNPAMVKRQIIGVATDEMADTTIQVCRHLGWDKVFVVHSHDGLDEISIAAPTKLYKLENGNIDEQTIDPSVFGFNANADISGGDAEYNLDILRAVLDGRSSSYRDITVLNTAYALNLSDLAADIREGISIAEDAIDSGNAKRKLSALVEYSRS